MATHTITPPGNCRGGTAPSRRDLLSAAGFTVLAGIAAVAIAKPEAQAVEALPTAHGADASLLALYEKYMVLQAQVDASDAGSLTFTDDEMSDLVTERVDLLDAMGDHVARTPAGHRARALALVAWYGLSAEGTCLVQIDEGYIWPVLRDLIGEAS